MKIKELRLTSFGKFSGKTIILEGNINLIYGLNEAGKSTIHKFIEGMIFGFFRPHRSMRLLNDDYDAYLPRMKDHYAGSMLIEFKGKELNIERNFSRNNPTLKIIDNVTGEDISNTLPQNSGTRLPDLPSYLGIDYTLYKDTISVAQMENETSGDLAAVVVEKISNLQTSKTESISVPNVIKEIERRESEIGSNKARTRPYFLTTQKLETFSDELNESKLKYQEIREHQKEISNLNNEFNKVSLKLKALNEQKDIYKNEQLKEKYEIVKKLAEKRNELEEKAEKLSQYKSLELETYNECFHLNSKIKDLKPVINKQEEELKNLLNKKADLEEKISKYNYLNEHDLKVSEIQNEYYNYQTLKKALDNDQAEIKRITNKEEAPLEYKNIKEDYIKYRKNNEPNYQQQINEVNYKINNVKVDIKNLEEKLPSPVLKYVYIALTIFIIGIFLLINYRKKVSLINDNISKNQDELKDLNKDLEELNSKYTNQQKLNEEIFKVYNVRSSFEFDTLYMENIGSVRASERDEKRLEELNEKLKTNELKSNKLKKELSLKFKNIINNPIIDASTLLEVQDVIKRHDDLKRDLETINKNLNDLKESFKENSGTLKENQNTFNEKLKNNKVENLESFKEGLNKKEEYTNYVKEIKGLNIRMKDYLGKITLEELKLSIDFDLEVGFDKETYERLLKDEVILREKYNELSKERIKYSEAINQIEKRYREPALIINDIEVTKTKLKELKNELEALDLIKTTLKNLSEEIRYEFAPKLNSEISNLIEKITNDKYNDVKIDKDMNVRVFEKATNRDVNINGFSKGTIDQIYFSMRLGINRTITENIYPLILDDSFVNYDKNRLKGVFKILANESKEENRQIIMFTCQDRERVILSDLNISHKYITI